MKMKYGSGTQGRVTTNPMTEKTATSAEKMAMWGNSGNTKYTRLPNYGNPRGAKKAKGGGKAARYS